MGGHTNFYTKKRIKKSETARQCNTNQTISPRNLLDSLRVYPIYLLRTAVTFWSQHCICQLLQSRNITWLKA